MEECYYTNIRFMDRQFGIYILTNDDNDQFDLQLEVRGSLCGDDFVLLRKYLIDEGYVEAARDWNKELKRLKK